MKLNLQLAIILTCFPFIDANIEDNAIIDHHWAQNAEFTVNCAQKICESKYLKIDKYDNKDFSTLVNIVPALYTNTQEKIVATAFLQKLSANLKEKKRCLKHATYSATHILAYKLMLMSLILAKTMLYDSFTVSKSEKKEFLSCGIDLDDLLREFLVSIDYEAHINDVQYNKVVNELALYKEKKL